MARRYKCPNCHRDATTDSKRGPLPKRCPNCGPRPLVSVPHIPDQLRVRQEDTVAQVLFQDKATLAVSMVINYASWAEVAAACGYHSEQAAYLAVKQETNRRAAELDESLDHIRRRELSRLDRMSAAAQRVLEKEHVLVSGGRVVRQVLDDGDGSPVLDKFGEPVLVPLKDDGPALAAIDRLLKISESRRKLLGLDAAQKVQNDVHVSYTVEGIAEGEMP